jgi:hypothetical protein
MGAKPFSLSDCRAVHLFLEKHGAFYHPCRVVPIGGGDPDPLVVNVAIAPAGQATMAREVDLLRKLAASSAALPEVLVQGHVRLPDRDLTASLFMARWMSGFHEFHLTWEAASSYPRPALWDPRRGLLPLEPRPAFLLYRGVAEILTEIYDLETFRQVGPWHHAAGDFIARIDGDEVQVKLITVRDYLPLVSGDTRDPVMILEALLLFLMDLSVRTRLDRIDGTGPLAWAGEECLAPTVLGFLEALGRRGPCRRLPDTPRACFDYFVSTFSEEEFRDLCREVLETYPQAAPERRFMRAKIDDHARHLRAILLHLMA